MRTVRPVAPEWVRGDGVFFRTPHRGDGGSTPIVCNRLGLGMASRLEWKTQQVGRVEDDKKKINQHTHTHTHTHHYIPGTF